MRSILQMLGAVVSLILSGIMSFGFLASFEQSGITPWKLGYGFATALLFGLFGGLLFSAIRGFQNVSR